MGYSQENGYTPATIETLMDYVRQGVNAQFNTSYTAESFLGSGFYKFFYAMVQRLQENDVKTSEIFLKLQDYFRITNERISRPVVTPPGLIDIFATNGFLISVKPPLEADAGKIFVCANVDDEADDYADVKRQICEILKNSTVGGSVTMGTETENFVLSNGQEFTYKFNLPDRITTLVRLTVTTSENNQFVIQSPEDIRFKVLQNINSRYALGKNFEPQKYYSLADAPWASQVLLEYSVDDGSTWETDIFDSDYDELLTVGLEDITIIQN